MGEFGSHSSPSIPGSNEVRGGTLALPAQDRETMANLKQTIRLIGVSAALLFTAGLFAQPGQTDMGEVSLVGGGAFGSTTGSHAAVGGSTGFAFARYAVFMVEALYMPLGNRTLVDHHDSVVQNSGLYDFNFALNLRVPLKYKVEPYGIAAPALLYNRSRQQTTLPGGGVAFVSGYSDLKFGFETGGGARYFIGNKWGVKGEYRYTISNRNFSRLVAGVFYQFGE